MVEGLTSSATDQGSAPRRVRGTPGAAAPVLATLKIPAPPARTPRGGAAAVCTRSDAWNPGDSSGEATPVPIPNTEVKLSSAEDTERAAFRENRSSPGFLRFRGGVPPTLFVSRGFDRRMRGLSCRHDRTDRPARDTGRRERGTRGVPSAGVGRWAVACGRRLAGASMPAPCRGPTDTRTAAGALPRG